MFGYNSFRWIRQDWRYVRELKRGSNGKRRFDSTRLCGSQTKDGKIRLCLPKAVIDELKRTKAGRDALSLQARKKLKAAKGERVPYNDIVLEAFKAFQANDTFRDKPQGRR